jgi:hypothetical protein
VRAGPATIAAATALAVATLAGGTARAQGTTTYGAEIQRRESQVADLDRQIRELEQEISKHELSMRDLKTVYMALDRLADQVSGRGRIFLDQDADLEPFHAAEVIVQYGDPIRSYNERIQIMWSEVPPIPIAGGQYVIRSGKDLINTYEFLAEHMPASIETRRQLIQRRDTLDRQRSQLIREIAALREGAVQAQAGASILGRWVLQTGHNASVVEVTRNPATGDYVATLVTDNLEYFTRGDVVFVVRPVAGRAGAFQGQEYGYSAAGTPKISPLSISITGSALAYRTAAESLQWARTTTPEERRNPLVPLDLDDLEDF